MDRSIFNNENINRIISDVKENIKVVLKNKLKKIYIFGSYAAGNYDSESDIDFLVIINEKYVKQYDDAILDISVDLSLKHDIVVSIFLENENNFQKYRDIKLMFKNIGHEGIEIYAS